MPNGSVFYCTVSRWRKPLRIIAIQFFRFFRFCFALFIPLYVCNIRVVGTGTVSGKKQHRLKCDRRRPHKRFIDAREISEFEFDAKIANAILANLRCA